MKKNSTSSWLVTVGWHCHLVAISTAGDISFPGHADAGDGTTISHMYLRTHFHISLDNKSLWGRNHALCIFFPGGNDPQGSKISTCNFSQSSYTCRFSQPQTKQSCSMRLLKKKKKSVYKWTLEAQTHVVQGLTTFVNFDVKHVLEPRSWGYQNAPLLTLSTPPHPWVHFCSGCIKSGNSKKSQWDSLKFLLPLSCYWFK